MYRRGFAGAARGVCCLARAQQYEVGRSWGTHPHYMHRYDRKASIAFSDDAPRDVPFVSQASRWYAGKMQRMWKPSKAILRNEAYL